MSDRFDWSNHRNAAIYEGRWLHGSLLESELDVLTFSNDYVAVGNSSRHIRRLMWH